MDVSDYRRQALKRWAENMGAANLARKVGRSDSQISQLLKEGGKGMGSRLARTFEELLGEPPGSFDLPGGYSISEVTATYDTDSDDHVAIGGDMRPDLLYVPAIVGASLSAGSGEILCEADEESNAVAFRRDWFIDKGLRPDRCKVWKVRGESMEPRYSHGDSLLLDMSDRTPRHGKRFALIGEDGLRVKQLLRGADHWIMHSHNPDKSRYPDEPIVQDNYAIIGRVRGRSGDED